MEILILQIHSIDFHYDEIDTNAVHFIVTDGYLSLQTCVYFDPSEDPPSIEPHIEFNSEEQAQYGGIDSIVSIRKS